jgi:predicted TIM-barrel fold metal-dependent hydrolase
MSNPITEAIRAGRCLTGIATVIDAHGHGGPYFNFWVPDSDPASMVRLMDHIGIQTLLFAPHLAVTADPSAGNDLAIAWSKRFPGRLLGYAVPYPHRPELVADDLRRALDAGLVAIKLHPSLHGCSIDSPGYRAAWEVARERHTFILSHTWYGDRYCAPGMFARYAEEFPEVPVIIGHSGGEPRGFLEAIELAHKYSNILLDTTGSAVTGEWIVRMVKEVGAERVLYGSDMPFLDPRFCLGKAALSGLAPDQLRLVLGLNAKCLLARCGVSLS